MSNFNHYNDLPKMTNTQRERERDKERNMRMTNERGNLFFFKVFYNTIRSRLSVKYIK